MRRTYHSDLSQAITKVPPNFWEPSGRRKLEPPTSSPHWDDLRPVGASHRHCPTCSASRRPSTASTVCRRCSPPMMWWGALGWVAWIVHSWKSIALSRITMWRKQVALRRIATEGGNSERLLRCYDRSPFTIHQTSFAKMIVWGNKEGMSLRASLLDS